MFQQRNKFQTGETVLHCASRAGNEEVLRTIVKKIGPGAMQIALNKQSKVNFPVCFKFDYNNIKFRWVGHL